ncbi:MAG: TetR/AcrR family transcriptional regulator [Solibacillus sp.]|uniref:TetR/AcrR family transcriptional regulator n=1 Tax=unclassified Solibacillus TaxID=2637870 RepID=UPI0030F60068
MEERRIRRTKNAFKMHFIALVKQKGYQAVTVTDIVDRADYNRSTFYVYYLDKEDLAQQLLEEMMHLLKKSFREPFQVNTEVPYQKIENRNHNTFFNHLYEHRHFYELLVVSDTLPQLNERFLEQFKGLFSSMLFLDEQKNIITVNHYNEYKMYGSYGVILEWIKRGFSEKPEQISATLLSIFKTTASSFRFI